METPQMQITSLKEQHAETLNQYYSDLLFTLSEVL